MLQLLYRDYHMTNQNHIKKAVIISFKKQVTEANFDEYSRQLKELLLKKFDTYIFYIRREEDLNSFTLKLMIAFSNTYTGKTGLLLKERKEELYDSLKLESIFVVNNDIKTIIIQLERAGRK